MSLHILELKVENCTAAVYLNGVPIAIRGMDHGPEFNTLVNHYLIAGLNELELVINPGSTPERALSGDSESRQPCLPEPEASAWVAISSYPEGAVIDGPDREELVANQWRPTSGRHYTFPMVRSVEFDLGDIYPTWQWQSAPPIILDKETHREICDFIIGMHGSLAIMDYERYVDLSQHRNNEADFALQRPPGSTSAELLNMKNFIAGDPNWGMAPLNPDTFSLRLCANNRMVECIGRDWEPVLTELPDDDGSVLRYPMFLSKIGGEWLIVR